jgi:transcriptional regulator with XRE-family HTH domain
MTTAYQLGKRIVYLRQQRQWSQLDLSIHSNINKNYLSDLEQGRRNPTLKILNRLCVAFSISLQDLFKGIDRPL